MKKVVMLIMGICFIVLGGTMIGLGFLMGGTFPKEFGFKDGKFTFGNEKLVEGSETLGKFDEFEIESDTANIKVIREGADYKVEYALGDEPEIKLDGDKLIIEEKSSFHIFGWNFSGNKKYINLYIPEDVKDMKECKVDVDTGSIEVSKLNFDKLTLKTDTGHIETSSLKVDEGEFKTSTGSMTLRSTDAKALTLKSSTGSQTVIDCDIEDIDADLDTGSFKMEHGSLVGGKIKTDTGSIKVLFLGELSDYEVSAKTDTGSVKINGNKEGKKFMSNGKNKLTLDTDTGSITLDMNYGNVE